MQVPEERFTLKQITQSIRKTIAERYARAYWVTAEMHKLNTTRKGHCYPELVQKEDGQIIAEMRGTIWKQQFERIQQRFADVVKEPIRDGMELLFLVKINYHPLYNIGLEIIDIDPNYTLGALQRERQETLERLNKEGILNANQQLEMALLPKRLAIISQADSKGYSDFVTLLNGHPKRYHFNTFLFEATLQGDAAVASIQGQLARIKKVQHHFDAVVIIRGGGGEIGMHCYNNYELAKSIATFPLPVLTGIGHSTNLTVCEMIAFRNGITPSDMAYFLLSIFEELDSPLDEAILKLPRQTDRFLQEKRHAFERIIRLFQQDVQLVLSGQEVQFQSTVKDFDFSVKRLLNYSNQQLTEARNQIRSTTQYLIETAHNRQQHAATILSIHTKNTLTTYRYSLAQDQTQLLIAVPRVWQQAHQQLENVDRNLQLVDPFHVLNRGYSIVTNTKGVLSEQNPAKVGDVLHILTDFSELKTAVNEVEPRKKRRGYLSTP